MLFAGLDQTQDVAAALSFYFSVDKWIVKQMNDSKELAYGEPVLYKNLLLFTLLTHERVPTYSTNNEEANYRNEVSQLVQWCKHNNLLLNVGKTKGTVVDFRRGRSQDPSLTANTKFLGVDMSEDLFRSHNSTACPYFLHTLRRVPPPSSHSTGAPLTVFSTCVTCSAIIKTLNL